MLVVSRKNGESVCLGDDIKITVVDIKGSRIRLGVVAGEDELILRAEMKEGSGQKLAEFRKASTKAA